jgi:hypothetical protein
MRKVNAKRANRMTKEEEAQLLELLRDAYDIQRQQFGRQLCRKFVVFSEVLANSRHGEPPDKPLLPLIK